MENIRSISITNGIYPKKKAVPVIIKNCTDKKRKKIPKQETLFLHKMSK